MTTSRMLRVLHALRLGGVVDEAAVARRCSLPPTVVEQELSRGARSGWCRRSTGALEGWALTSEGRAHGEALLADELDRSGRRAVVEECFSRFELLNPELLSVCSDWQVRRHDGVEVPNDHADPRHDRAVLVRLGLLDRAAQGVAADLGRALERFSSYGPRLRVARERVRAGEWDWFTRPTIDSYHTVWFEWHEDLLATLGRRRRDPRGADRPRPDRTTADRRTDPSSTRESA